MRYKLFLHTDDTSASPRIADVSLTFSSDCVPYGQVLFQGLPGGNHAITVSRTGYQTYQNDSLLLLDSYFSLAQNETWRAQEVNIVLSLPVGKTVFLSPEMKNIIYDVDNVSDTYDSKMVRHYWIMKPEGLTCIDHNFAETKNNTQHEKMNGDDKNFDYKDFSELEVHGHFIVNVKKGDKYDVS